MIFMKNSIKKSNLAILAVCTMTSIVCGENNPSIGTAAFELVKIAANSEAKCDAAYFQGGGAQIAIFVPGAIFDKESWYFLAKILQQKEISSLTLDGKTKNDVQLAIESAKENGYKEIILVGGSMGGSAILAALEAQTDRCISKVILLAPAGGIPLGSEHIDKLFIVSKKDRLGLYTRTNELYKKSSDPKQFVEVEGTAHAQHLFKTSQREFLTKLIIDFIVIDR